jgi:hypothetical protein
VGQRADMVALKRRRLLVAVFALGVVAALVAASLFLLPRTSPATNCIPSPPIGLANDRVFVLSSCGSTVTIGSHSYTSYSVARLSDGESVVGQYVTNLTVNVSLEAYLLNTSEFSELLSHPHPTAPPPAYLWNSGPVHVCNLSVSVPGSPIQYYVVLLNLGAEAISVEWTQALVVYYASG